MPHLYPREFRNYRRLWAALSGGDSLDIFYRFFGKPDAHPVFLDFNEVDQRMPGKRIRLVGEIVHDAQSTCKKLTSGGMYKSLHESNPSFVAFWENRIIESVFSQHYPVPNVDIQLVDKTTCQTIIELADGVVDFRTSVQWKDVVSRFHEKRSVRRLFPSLFDGNLAERADAYKRQKEAKLAADAERRRVAEEQARQRAIEQKRARDVGLFQIDKFRERIRALEQIAMYGESFEVRVQAIYGIEASQHAIRELKAQIGYVPDSYEDNLRTG